MRLIYNILIILSSLILFECNPTQKKATVKSDCDSLLTGRTVNEIVLPLYIIDSSFVKFLETIVNEESKCTFFDSCQSGFLYSSYEAKVYTSNTQKSSALKIIISSTNIYNYDYSDCIGIFEYGGFRFICYRNCDKSLLTKTDKIKKNQVFKYKEGRYLL